MGDFGRHSFAILPAAGGSTRMGRPKLLLSLHDRSVIEHVIAAWQQSAVDDVVVVVRSGDVELQRVVQSSGAHMVVPDSDPPDMKQSVLYGLRAVVERFSPADRDVWLLSPADTPWISAEIIDAVLGKAMRYEDKVVVAAAGGRTGHPVLFPWRLAAAVKQLGPQQGINQIVADHADVSQVDVGTADIHLQFNTPQDYQRLLDDWNG